MNFNQIGLYAMLLLVAGTISANVEPNPGQTIVADIFKCYRADQDRVEKLQKVVAGMELHFHQVELKSATRSNMEHVEQELALMRSYLEQKNKHTEILNTLRNAIAFLQDKITSEEQQRAQAQPPITSEVPAVSDWKETAQTAAVCVASLGLLGYMGLHGTLLG